MDAQGALYHFIIQGMERKAIFKEDDDVDNFVEGFGPGTYDLLVLGRPRQLPEML